MQKVDQDGMHPLGMVQPCWDWKGCTDAYGRPRFYLNDKGELAKRALFEILTDQILPNDCAVSAICGNKLCVRPEHLVMCNDTDAQALGPYGHIGPGEAMAIRKRCENGYEPAELAAFLGVSVPLIEAIIREGASNTPANEPRA